MISNTFQSGSIICSAGRFDKLIEATKWLAIKASLRMEEGEFLKLRWDCPGLKCNWQAKCKNILRPLNESRTLKFLFRFPVYISHWTWLKSITWIQRKSGIDSKFCSRWFLATARLSAGVWREEWCGLWFSQSVPGPRQLLGQPPVQSRKEEKTNYLELSQ